MSQLLKDKFYNKVFYKGLASNLKQVYPELDQQRFYKNCLKDLNTFELKQRITHTTEVVAEHLPQNYYKALDVLYGLAELIEEDFPYLFLSEFVARYGREDIPTSLNALRDFTIYSSSEFAVREFLELDVDQTINAMMLWAEHDNAHIRRLASEGSRPRLPWAHKLDIVIENPSVTWPILDRLKTDKEKYVQKSVANHLNDIAKDNAEWMLKRVKRWQKLKNTNTQWIIKHACRNLIKQNHPDAMVLFGFGPAVVKAGQLKLKKKTIHLGDSLAFSFDIQSDAKQTQQLVVDYIIHFVKKNGQRQAKVFKLKTFEISSGEAYHLKKSHRFDDFTTRRHYAGEHSIEIIVNGQRIAQAVFQLKL